MNEDSILKMNTFNEILNASIKELNDIFIILKNYTITKIYVHKDLNYDVEIFNSCNEYYTSDFTLAKKFTVHKAYREDIINKFYTNNLTFVISNGFNYILIKNGEITICKQTDLQNHYCLFYDDVTHLEYNIMESI